MNPVLAATAALLAARLAAELILSGLNRTEVRRRAAEPPEAIRAAMDGATFERSVSYTLAKSRFGEAVEILDALVLAALVFGGALPWLWSRVLTHTRPDNPWAGATFILTAGLALGAASLPFDAWSQFRLEAKFGFNRITPGLWIADKLKGLALAIAIGVPLLSALLALARQAGSLWWLWSAALLVGFQLAMVVLYPKLILPLFNKLEPLPEGELRSRLLALGDRTGFRARAVQVIDGSKRSAHSNAFFTGFGRFRRIVLFDTLINQLSAEELEAVLAHEVGHYRLRHVPKHLAAGAAGTFAGFGVLAWLASSSWFNPAFGFAPGALAPSFLLFGLLSGLATFWFAPLKNLISRRHEYAADAFARDAMGGPAPLIGALRRLAEKNLSNLTPHPWFSAFFYSHPTLVERERALGK